MSGFRCSHRARRCCKFKAEMKASDPARTLDMLAALSHSTELAVGCYCADEARCHRGVLRELLAERGARIDGHATSDARWE
jgi:uncharacterized protein YeaO (DUF488 family)